MTDFLRLKIELYSYRRIAERAEFFASVGEWIEDAVTSHRGDGDWFGEVQDYFNEVRSVWKTLEEREAEGLVQLNHESPERYLANVQPDQIGTMGLVEVLTLLRKVTAAEPKIEEYNWTCPGDQPQKQDPERDRRFIEAFQKGLILPALQRLNNLLEITHADINAVLRLKPILDSLSVEEFRKWNGAAPVDLPEGGQALHVPYPEYHPVVNQWSDAIYCTPFFIDPYREVSGHEDGVPAPRFLGLGERGKPSPNEFFADADLDEVRQYMALCLRGEKWCDGYIAGEFERGVIQAAFARLEQLSEPNRQQLPDHWNRFSLCDSFIQIDSGLWTGKKEPLKSCLVLRNVDFTNEGRLRSGTGAVVDIEARQLPKKALNHEDVLVERSGGGPKQPVGRVVLYEDRGCEASFSNFTARLRVTDTDRIQPRFLLWCLFDFYAKGATIPMQRGATGIRNLDFDAYKRARHPLPPLNEQAEIVRTLEAIQAARLSRLREIELERERKAALMAHLFAYGTLNEPRRDSPLGPLPKSWDVVPLGSVCTFISGGTPSKARPEYWIGEVPWVSGKDLKKPRLTDTIDHISEEGAAVGSKLAPANSILILVRGMALARNVPMSQITRPMAFNQDLKAICPPDEATGDYLYWALQQVKPDFEQHIGMAAHGTRKIAGAVLYNLPIAMPAEEERTAIARALWTADACGTALEAEATHLDELFRATLEELMSGRLPLSGQDKAV